jgi:hypothetical protein
MSVVCGRKLCTSPDHVGGRWLPQCDFYVAEWKPGKRRPKRLQSWCCCCTRRANRARAGVARRGSAYVRRTDRTPEELERRADRRRERQREAATFRRRRDGARAYDLSRRYPPGREVSVDAGPFLEWAAEMRCRGIDGTFLCRAAGLDEAVLRRARERGLRLSTIDLIMVAWGAQHVLAASYVEPEP